MNYSTLEAQTNELIKDVPYMISNLSNISALLFQEMKEINWVGFYLFENNKLILGPFQGKPACIEIENGKGVCGTSTMQDKTILVEDVHKFKGHIACDADSNSEIVIPIHKDNKIYGVLDIDSPILNRFNNEDKEGLEKIVKLIEEKLKHL